jgi:selenocysteine-specific elongation factor
MSNIIIGTAGHIDHGKTALIKALNGFEGDSTKEELSRGITIDLSFSNMKKNSQNIAFIDVPGHEKLVKNMISGAFGFDYVMIVVSLAEGIMPQTKEHLEIIDLLGIKEIIVVLTKKDLVDPDKQKKKQQEVESFLKEFNFTIKLIQSVSIYDQVSIDQLKEKLFTITKSTKSEENFFRFYIDRIFSPKGIGTVVTGTVLGKKIELEEDVIVVQSHQKTKIKNIQVHNENVMEASISNRAALNLKGIQVNSLQKGDLITKKGFLRGFNQIDISYTTLQNKQLKHDHFYSLFIGAKKIDVKVLLLEPHTTQENGFATLKANEKMYTIFGEKLILRDGNKTIAGGKVLNPIIDPMKKAQKKALLETLEKNDFLQACDILLEVHKKGLGFISSTQRFAMSHEDVIALSRKLQNVFVDKKELVIYPNSTQEYIIQYIKELYNKNQYALLSLQSIQNRLKWASLAFIDRSLNGLLEENFLKKEGNLFKKAELTIDIINILEEKITQRLKDERFMPTAPYNIYDDLDIDRKLGDTILKSLCSKKIVKRLQHNLFIHNDNLIELVKLIEKILATHGYIDIKLFREYFNASRKYLTTYLDYFDTISNVEKVNDKRVLKS